MVLKYIQGFTMMICGFGLIRIIANKNGEWSDVSLIEVILLIIGFSFGAHGYFKNKRDNQ
ncbi:MAG: hypothetical protein ACI9XP_002124 [Lentimonas sp.]|jgi:hypothetical protein